MSKDHLTQRQAASHQHQGKLLLFATKLHFRYSNWEEQRRRRLIQITLFVVALITLILTVIIGHLTLNIK